MSRTGSGGKGGPAEPKLTERAECEGRSPPPPLARLRRDSLRTGARRREALRVSGVVLGDRGLEGIVEGIGRHGEGPYCWCGRATAQIRAYVDTRIRNTSQVQIFEAHPSLRRSGAHPEVRPTYPIGETNPFPTGVALTGPPATIG